MAVTDEVIVRKTGEQTAGNACLYDAAGNPVLLVGGAVPVSLSGGGMIIITGGLVPRGIYDDLVDYAVGDSVDYGGSSYVMSVDAPAGTLPTDTAYWQLLAEKGDTGPQGIPGDPGPPGADGAPGVVQSIVPGSGISVDSTDPANPIVTATGGPGSTGDFLFLSTQASDPAPDATLTTMYPYNDGVTKSVRFLFPGDPVPQIVGGEQNA